MSQQQKTEERHAHHRKMLRALGIDGLNDSDLKALIDDVRRGESYGPDLDAIGQVWTFQTGIGPLENLGIGPGRITLFGGLPKIGKTDLVNQLVVDALRIDPELLALIANAEMGHKTLTARIISRLSGVPVEMITAGPEDEDARKRIRDAQDILFQVLMQDDDHGRFEFLAPPFSTFNIAVQLAFNLNYSQKKVDRSIVVLDFIQCFKGLDRSRVEEWKAAHKKSSVAIMPPLVSDLGQVMDDLRSLARQGVAIIIVSRLNRQGYDDAALGGFHGSGELEYQCDNAFILTRDEEQPGVVVLRHVASRDCETRDRLLRFDGRIHRFTPLDEEGGSE